MKSNIWNVN